MQNAIQVGLLVILLSRPDPLKIAAMTKADINLKASLPRARAARGWTQKELATASSVSVDWVRRVEQGGGSPSLEVLERMAVALGVPLAVLLEDDEKRASIAALEIQLQGLDEEDVSWLLTAAQYLQRRKRPASPLE